MRVPRGNLRREYKTTLQMVWDRWNTPVWREGGPFWSLSDVPDLDANADYNYAVGWIQGVSDATGWSFFKKTKVTDEPMLGRPKEFQESYDNALEKVWRRFLEKGPTDGSPFFDLEDVPELDEDADFNHSVGWVLGVSEATGWPLDRILGPREWSPRGSRGIKDV